MLNVNLKMQILLVIISSEFCFTNANSVKCHTCAHMTKPWNHNRSETEWKSFLPLDQSCARDKKPNDEFSKACLEPSENCAVIFFLTSWWEIAIRTCLPPLLNIQNRCDIIKNNNDKQLVKSYFQDFFPMSEQVNIRFCTCTTSKCLAYLSSNRSSVQFSYGSEEFSKLLGSTIQKFHQVYKNNSSHLKATKPENRTTYISEKPAFKNAKFGRQLYVNASQRTNTETSSAKTEANQVSTSENANFVPDEKQWFQKVPPFVWILAPLAGIVLFFVIVLANYIHRKRSASNQRVDEELHRFYNKEFLGNLSLNQKVEKFGIFDLETYEQPASSFKIDKSKVLRAGEYEKVYRSKITHNGTSVKVATKTIREKLSSPDTLIAVRMLVQEMRALSFIGKHDNITGFYGTYTEKMYMGRICLFLELCSFGSLHSFIYRNQHKNSLLRTDLINWAKEISQGMTFLASKHISHADLCLRNVFLDSQKTAKVANFYFARSFNADDCTSVQYLQPTNWQWMAPELIRSWEFNEKTDVWAYAVTLWEMYSGGSQPFSKLAWRSNFATQLERGLRLNKPEGIDADIHLLMLRCWNIDPSSRPTFSEICTTLT